MPYSAERFVLRGTLTSPFARKVRMFADVLGLAERIDLVPTDAADETLRTQNPLGKYPCLLRADGTPVFDSSVILEFLQEVAGVDRLLPASGPDRILMLTRTRLADGIIDAGALIIYEGRYHEAGMQSAKWLEYQGDKIRRALAGFDAARPDPRRSDAVSIGLACALGFIERRHPAHWTSVPPGLVSWLRAFSESEPSYERTRAPD